MESKQVPQDEQQPTTVTPTDCPLFLRSRTPETPIQVSRHARLGTLGVMPTQPTTVARIPRQCSTPTPPTRLSAPPPTKIPALASTRPSVDAVARLLCWREAGATRTSNDDDAGCAAGHRQPRRRRQRQSQAGRRERPEEHGLMPPPASSAAPAWVQHRSGRLGVGLRRAPTAGVRGPASIGKFDPRSEASRQGSRGHRRVCACDGDEARTASGQAPPPHPRRGRRSSRGQTRPRSHKRKAG